jgi:uncharacterized protein
MSEPTKIVVSWDELDRLVAGLAERLVAEPSPDVVLAISRGGLVPAGMLGYRLGWRDMLLATVVAYDDEHGFKGQAEFLQFPPEEQLRGKRVLIVDEVWDSGTTIAAVSERVRAAGGEPVTAVLHYKPSRSRVGLAPDHFMVETDDWIVYPFKAGR